MAVAERHRGVRQVLLRRAVDGGQEEEMAGGRERKREGERENEGEWDSAGGDVAAGVDGGVR